MNFDKVLNAIENFAITAIQGHLMLSHYTIKSIYDRKTNPFNANDAQYHPILITIVNSLKR